jgi:2-C-methyl-D-erythritol 4-phosphate cytidylyltransferase / 2-C-methyl-D-erythritol 2,4-cyclodiphosphate synthase
MPGHVAAIIAAAGSGLRFGADLPKALIQLGDKTLIEHAVAAISPAVDEVIVTAPASHLTQFQRLLGDAVTVVAGGQTRSESVRAGLAAVSGDMKYVLIHDAARALATTELANRVLSALQNGEVAVIPGVPQVDTIKNVDSNGYVISTPNRADLRNIQTPQGFELTALKKAHATNGESTDDAALVESAGFKVLVIAGEERALKITTPADLATAYNFLGSNQEFLTGVGVDAHAFEVGRELWLGCLSWPDEVGVAGHSDGDVAAHAICDSLFAATGLGDLGSNFGVDRPEYAGASGAKLLAETLSIITNAGFAISNVSVQVIGNRPKLAARRKEAIAALSAALNGAPVSLLATTTDGLGLTGEGKGIAAIASALVFKVSSNAR